MTPAGVEWAEIPDSPVRKSLSKGDDRTCR
jgi:hypothetical protein